MVGKEILTGEPPAASPVALIGHIGGGFRLSGGPVPPLLGYIHKINVL